MMEACLNTIVTLSRKCQEANIIVSLNNSSNIRVLRNHVIYLHVLCVLFYPAGNW